MSRAIVKGKKKQLTEENYNAIKSILPMSDLNDTQLGKAVNRAGSTIGYIRKSKDYKDYKSMLSSSKKSPPVFINATTGSAPLTLDIGFDDLLAELNQKMDLIITRLDKLSSKRGFFK